MNLKNISCDIYIGRKAGVKLQKTIDNAKESIVVLSPFVSNKFLKKVQDKKRKGVEVEVLFSQENINFNNYFKNQFCKQTQRPIFLYVIGFVFFCIACYGGFYIYENKYSEYYYNIPGILLLTSFYLFNKKGKYKPLFNFRVYDSKAMRYLVHSKIYIIDHKHLFIGSINFTNRGNYINHETIISITDQNAINGALKEVESIKKRMIYKDLTGIIRKI